MDGRLFLPGSGALFDRKSPAPERTLFSRDLAGLGKGLGKAGKDPVKDKPRFFSFFAGPGALCDQSDGDQACRKAGDFVF